MSKWKKGTYTQEEKKKYLEEKQKELNEYSERIEEGILSFLDSDKYKAFLSISSKFHSYSLNNLVLIYLQRPDATHVASYTTWKKLKRYVKKGEKAIKIFTPVRKAFMEKKKDENGKEVLDENGKPEKERIYKNVAYTTGSVYDISQTDGEPLAALDICQELTGTMNNYEQFIEAAKSIAPCPVSFREINGGAKGYYSGAENEIVIKNGMSQVQTAKTLIHELTHSLLHNKVALKGEKKDSASVEIEAESTAFMVLSAFSINTEDYSFPYIATWGSGREMKELKASLQTIKETASMIIDELKEKMQEEPIQAIA